MASGKGSAGSNLTGSFNTSRNGDGYREHWSLPLTDWRDAGLILTGATTPLVEISSNEMRVTWAATDTDSINASITLDGHASETSHDLQLIARMLQTGSTDTIVMTATLYARSADGAKKGPFTATATLTAGGTNPERVVFDFKNAQDASDNYIEPGDVLNITLAPSGNATDASYLYGTILQRRRNPGLTDMDDRVRSTW